jgi:hypothetical protein
MATTMTLNVRWHGTAWRHAASPILNPNSVLTAVAAISASNVWVAGADANGSILQYWNGTT